MATDHPKAEILAQIARRKELIEASKKIIEESKNLVEQSHRLILIAMGHDAMGKANKTNDCHPHFFSTFSSSRTKSNILRTRANIQRTKPGSSNRSYVARKASATTGGR